jgi:transforming growth factor-beta-induced protein
MDLSASITSRANGYKRRSPTKKFEEFSSGLMNSSEHLNENARSPQSPPRSTQGENMSSITRRRFVAVAVSSFVAFGSLLGASGASAQDDPDGPDQAQNSSTKTVVQKLAKAGNYTTLITAVKAAGLVDALSNTQGITVFAPTDAAFAKIPAADLQAIIADKAKLTDILTYHVSPKRLGERGLARRGKAPTLNGADITVTGTPEDLVLNGNVNVILGDIKASNGVIHSIDSVLLPPAKPVLKDVVDTAIAAGSFKTLVTAVQAAGLESALRTTKDITVFAPTDAAFAKLGAKTINELLSDKPQLTALLTYHVLPKALSADQIVGSAPGSVKTLEGENVTYQLDAGKLVLNGYIMVTATDIKASNGIIHVIDAVLVPPSFQQQPPKEKDVVDTAIAAGSFKTLIAAAQAAGLESTLRTTQNITVFAPTDAAFEKLGKPTIDALLADPATLKSILLYHVVPFQKIDSSYLVGAKKGLILTANFNLVKFELKDGKVFLNDNVQIVATDIKASNGIIHVIDTVLIPPKK